MQKVRYCLFGVGLSALLLAACGGGGANATASTATIARGDLVQSVSGSGQVQPAQSIDLNFSVVGTVSQVLVSEGQSVKQGDTLALIETADLDQQILQAEANLKSAQAALEALQTGASETDIRSARAQLETAQRQLDQTQRGNARATDIASARAQLRSAQADLAALKNPTAEDLSTAELRVTQAQNNLQSTRDSDSAAKTRAEIELNKATLALTQAQSRYAVAAQNWQYVQETGRDPMNPSKTNAQGKSEPNKLNDAQRQQYYDTYIQAEAQLHSAEASVSQSQLEYDNARQKEVTDVQNAEAQLADAQQQLDALHNPSAQKVAAAEARVAQAQAQLNQLLGGTQSDIAIAQAALEQRQAALDALLAPPQTKDVAQAEANVAQAAANLAKAKIARQNAQLNAPFNGIVAAVNIKPGDTVGSSSGSMAIALVDVSSFHIDVNISEADLAQLKEGQSVDIEVDALPGKQIIGSLDYIAPVAKTEQNVTTYLTRIGLKQADPQLRVGMSTSVSVIIDKRVNVVLVPNAAIRDTDTGTQVLLRRGNQSTLVPIQIGLAGDLFTEVTNGLQEGDVVELPTPRQSGGFGG